MLSVDVWIWRTRNGLTTLKRHIHLEVRSWGGSFSKWRKAGCASAHIPHLLSAINHQLLHALCKVLKCSHKPCCKCTDCLCVIVFYVFLTQNLFVSVFLDFWFIMFCGNKNDFASTLTGSSMHNASRSTSTIWYRHINSTTYSKNTL